MVMMYRIVAQALENAGLSDQCHPQEYLNFYCLGKREASSSESSPQTNTENRSLVCYFSCCKIMNKVEIFSSDVFLTGVQSNPEWHLLGYSLALSVCTDALNCCLETKFMSITMNLHNCVIHWLRLCI